MQYTYILQILVLPPAVPPVTPINNGFFLMSNLSGFHAVYVSSALRALSPLIKDVTSPGRQWIVVSLSFYSSTNLFPLSFFSEAFLFFL